MGSRLELIHAVMAAVFVAGVCPTADAQFGLSAGPELLPWLRSDSAAPAGHDTSFAPAGTSPAGQPGGVTPPLPAGWLAPTGPASIGTAAHPEDPPGGGWQGNPGESLRPTGEGPLLGSPSRDEATWTGRAGDPQGLLEIPSVEPSANRCFACLDPQPAPSSCWQWFIEPMGLVMGRNDPNRVWFTYQSNNNANELMNSQDARASWQGGWEMTIRRTFACQTWRLEATYWGLARLDACAAATHPDLVSSTLMFTDVVYADPSIPGSPEDLFFGAYEQRLWRTNEVHNLEVNLVRQRIPWEIHRLGIDWLAGVRYFRFDERLTYGSRIHQGAWGANPEEEGFLSDRIENDLIGVQLGFDMHYPLGKSLELVCTPKIGLYNNHIRNRFDAYRGDGEIFAPNPDPPVGDPVPGRYPVISSDDRFAVLGQLDARVQWHATPRCTAYLGYRLVCVSEIGLADAQFPPYVVDIVDAIAHIDSNGDLLLHGAFAGISLAF